MRSAGAALPPQQPRAVPLSLLRPSRPPPPPTVPQSQTFVSRPGLAARSPPLPAPPRPAATTPVPRDTEGRPAPFGPRTRCPKNAAGFVRRPRVWAERGGAAVGTSRARSGASSRGRAGGVPTAGRPERRRVRCRLSPRPAGAHVRLRPARRDPRLGARPPPRGSVPSSQLGQKEKMALDLPPEVTNALICMSVQSANGIRGCVGPLGRASQTPWGPCLKLDRRLWGRSGGVLQEPLP